MFLILSAIIACSGGAEPAPAEVAPTQEAAPVVEQQIPEVAPAAEATTVATTTEATTTTTTTK